ncbi:hypothetical protein GQ53DRAFT_463683 [Thozetella sp. PMI_491]|nr:hypothetical protein GQ53DRAFT_463683 [Thozetella sp. PMI_491]
MADVRSLLRQQRAARRIEHPHAAYADSGKLLCTLCHEHIKADSLWDGHIRGAGHRQRIQALQAKGNDGEKPESQTHSHKRKLDEDDEMLDVPETEEEAVRKKRSKPDMTLAPLEDAPTPSADQVKPGEATAKKEEAIKVAPKPLTPPSLQRRTSTTPVLGVEIQIPSRPATPIGLGRDGTSGSGAATTTSASATSTPKIGPGKSPSVPATAGFVGNGTSAPLVAASTSTPVSQPAVDEDEWAAFEADVINGAAPKFPTAAIPSEVVITAPAMTAEEVAAKAQEEDQDKRKALADIELEDEKEEATRALELEFEEMEELEARVRKLKERREALRQQKSDTVPSAALSDDKERPAAAGKENGVAEEEEEDDDGEDDEDEDDWAGFRFRA